ncbi:hypothetical protein [[Muricauda] lutisoli]|uniref:PH domain-containing protein n=1 Tax=[Muricauda] lutisoli TaxID=2816035 RepID=A0ABS3EVG3_9FLAO|nr:hypothetical protein [[Muricauda] lutisoli]MBO0330232.1 hypothetical protein [[Muricauda] lutisoli]
MDFKGFALVRREKESVEFWKKDMLLITIGMEKVIFFKKKKNDVKSSRIYNIAVSITVKEVFCHIVKKQLSIISTQQ